MGGFKVSGSTFVALLLFMVPLVTSLNLGLIAGDLKRHSSPLVTKKISKHSPVFINIKSDLLRKKTSLSLPRLPLKPPPLKLLSSKKSSKKPRSILSPFLPPLLPPLPLLPPILPGLPLVPTLPLLRLLLPLLFLPFLPPPPLFLPLLPLIPSLSPPVIPPLPPLSQQSLLSPLKIPILKGSPLSFKPDLKILDILPLSIGKKKSIMDKLLDILKKQGSLTTAELFRFKKILLKK